MALFIHDLIFACGIDKVWVYPLKISIFMHIPSNKNKYAQRKSPASWWHDSDRLAAMFFIIVKSKRVKEKDVLGSGSV